MSERSRLEEDLDRLGDPSLAYALFGERARWLYRQALALYPHLEHEDPFSVALWAEEQHHRARMMAETPEQRRAALDRLADEAREIRRREEGLE